MTTKWDEIISGQVPDIHELYTKGFLLPNLDQPPVMTCSNCGLPVMLVLNQGPVDIDAEVAAGRKLPSLMWGDDVSVVCYCCSYVGCPHKDQEAA